jgi:hypothetical protein
VTYAQINQLGIEIDTDASSSARLSLLCLPTEDEITKGSDQRVFAQKLCNSQFAPLSRIKVHPALVINHRNMTLIKTSLLTAEVTPVSLN